MFRQIWDEGWICEQQVQDVGHELLWRICHVLFSRLVQNVMLLSAASPSIYCVFAKSTLIHGTIPSERWCSLDPWRLLGWWHWLKAGRSASWKQGVGDSSLIFACCCFQTLAVAWFVHKPLLPKSAVKGSRLWVGVSQKFCSVGKFANGALGRWPEIGFCVTRASFCRHDIVRDRAFWPHVQWIRDVVDVLCYFVRGGGTICGTCMDLTHSSFCGRWNEFMLAGITCVAYFLSSPAFCIVMKWWQGHHFVTSLCAVAFLFWIAFNTCFLVMLCHLQCGSPFYVWWLLKGVDFMAGRMCKRFGGRLCTFRAVIAVPIGVLQPGHVPSRQDLHSCIMECVWAVAQLSVSR